MMEWDGLTIEGSEEKEKFGEVIVVIFLSFSFSLFCGLYFYMISTLFWHGRYTGFLVLMYGLGMKS